MINLKKLVLPLVVIFLTLESVMVLQAQASHFRSKLSKLKQKFASTIITGEGITTPVKEIHRFDTLEDCIKYAREYIRFRDDYNTGMGSDYYYHVLSNEENKSPWPVSEEHGTILAEFEKLQPRVTTYNREIYLHVNGMVTSCSMDFIPLGESLQASLEEFREKMKNFNTANDS